jgi:hypothetical protein
MEEIGNELLARLDLLAEKLGTTADKLWEVCVKQAYIQGYYAIFWAIMSCVSAYLWCRFVKRYWDDPDGDLKPPILIGSLFVGAFLIAAFGCNIDNTMALINPEYYAFHEILSHIGGK